VQRGEQFSAAHHFERATIPGSEFRHVVFRNGVTPDGELHVYLDGDGSPFSDPYDIAADPTPRQPVMLWLMALDPAPSVYIGRPCYWGLAGDPGCSPIYWTLGRFNSAVIDSCSAAIRSELARSGARHWSLYAHSGGAAIAFLVAQRLPGAERIVTIGPNLDTDAWSALHGYTPLFASENPATRLVKRTEIPATHYVGSQDRNTPPDLVRAAARRVGGEVVVVDDYSHSCCWGKMWRDILGHPAARTDVPVPETEMRADLPWDAAGSTSAQTHRR
jgi:pimeloyl-ACP methyl ester carboxylesterase